MVISMKELKKIRELLDAFNEEIVYCHWKSNSHFSDALIGVDDLDILINRDDYAKTMKILYSLGLKHFYTPKERTYIGIEDFLGFDEESGIIFHLHLHTQLDIGEKHLKGFHIPLEYYILKNRRYDENMNVYMSSYSDELLMLIIRAALKLRCRDRVKEKLKNNLKNNLKNDSENNSKNNSENKSKNNSKITSNETVEKNAVNEFLWLKENDKEFKNYVLDLKFLSYKAKKRIISIYEKGFNTNDLLNLRDILYNECECYSLGSKFYNTNLRHYREFKRIIFEINKRYLHKKYSFNRRRVSHGGLLIAFLGSDGAGKSSNISEVNKWLKKVMDVRYFYLGSGDGNSSIIRLPLKYAKRLAIKLGIIKVNNNFQNDKLEDKEVKKSLGFARRIWVFTLSLERIKKLISANRCKMRGFVVLTDRFPQSEFNGLCDGPKCSEMKGMAAKLERISFKVAKNTPPDVVIKFIVSPDVAKKRKPGEIDEKTSLTLTNRIKNIKFSEKTKIYEIDADKSKEEVLREVKKIVWESI